MPRDLLGQIKVIRARADSSPDIQVEFALEYLQRTWEAKELVEKYGQPHLSVPIRYFIEFAVVRMVTLLEVFARAWTTVLIDAGPPFVENASALEAAKGKLDFALSKAIQGKRLTLGEIISHEISTNSFADIVGVLSTLIGHDILNLMGVNRRGEQIITDMPALRADLVALFDARHIIVHELPRKDIVSSHDLTRWINASVAFVDAADFVLQTKLHGKYPPMTQLDMNLHAAEQLDAAQQKLDEFAKSSGLVHNDRFTKVLTAFESYAEAHAKWASHLDAPGWAGSGASMEYALLKAAIVEAFLESLRRD